MKLSCSFFLSLSFTVSWDYIADIGGEKKRSCIVTLNPNIDWDMKEERKYIRFRTCRNIYVSLLTLGTSVHLFFNTEWFWQIQGYIRMCDLRKNWCLGYLERYSNLWPIANPATGLSNKTLVLILFTVPCGSCIRGLRIGVMRRE